jgi:F0F1-type ATP synthase assembly protein I
MDLNFAARRSFLRAIGVALIAGLGAIPTAGLMILTLLLGRWLDNTFGTQPFFLLGLLCLIIPVSIFLMLRLALFAAKVAARLNQQDHEVLLSSAKGVEEDQN